MPYGLGLYWRLRDRKKDGLCTRLSISDNIALPNLDMLCKGLFGTMRPGEGKRDGRGSFPKALKIRMSGAQVDRRKPCRRETSEKVVVAKWLARNSRVCYF